MSKADSKRRHCPALEREITPADCGENRGSKYACPPECPFNPWSPANYEDALSIEDGLTGKLMRQLASDAARDPKLRKEIDDILLAGDAAKQRFFVSKFHIERDAAGHVFSERMLLHRAREFKNDERFLLARMGTMRPSLIEIHEVLDDSECRAVDLLNPGAGSFVIHDRSLASQAVRFFQSVSWVFAMPHYHRMHGAAVQMIEVSGLDAPEVLRETVKHLGGPTESEDAVREWIAGHFDRLVKAFEATSLAMRRSMFEALDAKFCRATYRVRGALPALQRQLRGASSVDAGEVSDEESAEGFTEAWDWFDEPRPIEPGQMALALDSTTGTKVGRPLLGRVLLAPKLCRIEASSAARYQSLRAQFEKGMGTLVEFTAERIDDLVASRIHDQPKYDASLVPPSFLEHAPRLAVGQSKVMHESPSALSKEETEELVARRHHEQWLDQPLPAFDGLTPRQAAKDPARRGTLLTMIKGFIRHHDLKNLRSGRNDDINWLVQALGLDEILFDPPPLRGSFEPEDDETWDEEQGIDEFQYEPPPPLPPGPLSPEEIEKRALATAKALPGPEDLMEEFEQAAPELVEAIDSVGEHLTEREDMVLFMLAATAWFTFFPVGTRPGTLRPMDFVEAVHRELDTLAEINPDDELGIRRHYQNHPQPAMIGFLSGSLAHLESSGPKKERLPGESALKVLTFLVAFTEELDRAAR